MASLTRKRNMRKKLLFISLFMIIVSIAYSDDDLSMKESSSNKDAYMLSLPTAYIMPKGQMRIQLCYNYNPNQPYFDLQYPAGAYRIQNFDVDIQRKNKYGLRFDVGVFQNLQMGISYSEYDWESKTGFNQIIKYSFLAEYNYFKRKYSQTTFDFKFTFIRERLYFPEISTFFRYSVVKTNSTIILKVEPNPIYNISSKSLSGKEKIEYCEDLFPILISKRIILNEDYYLTFTFSIPLINYMLGYIHHVRQTWGGLTLNIKNIIFLGYENKINYFTEYVREGAGTGDDVSYRISSETKYFLILNLNEKFQLQGCYLIHKGSKYLNYKYDKYGFGLTYNFKILKGKK